MGLNPSVNDAAGDRNGDGVSNLNEFTRDWLAVVVNIADGSGYDDSWDVLTNGQVVASCRYVNENQTVVGRAVVFVPKGVRVKFTLARYPLDQEVGTDEYELLFELAADAAQPIPWVPVHESPFTDILPYVDGRPPDTSGIYWEYDVPKADLEGHDALRTQQDAPVPETQEVQPGVLISVDDGDPGSGDMLEAKMVVKPFGITGGYTRWLHFSDHTKVRVVAEGLSTPEDPGADIEVGGDMTQPRAYEIHQYGSWAPGDKVAVDLRIKDPDGTVVSSDTITLVVLKVDLDVGDGSGGSPDGDLEDPEDGVRAFLPGERGGVPVISGSPNPNNPSQILLSFQPLKIVALAPGLASVAFDIPGGMVSQWRGYTTDTLVPNETKPDFSFDRDTYQDSYVVPVANGKAVAPFWCKDYGGWCRVRIRFLDSAGSVVYTYRLDIPRDDDHDGISDQWEEDMVREWNTQYGAHETVGNTFFNPDHDAELPDPDGDAGPLAAHASPGDGLSVREEYRGFDFLGSAEWGVTTRFHRLSPARKNLLVEVDSMQGFATTPTAPEIAGCMAAVKSAFMSSAGAQVDYAVDRINLPYASFSVSSDLYAYRATHRGVGDGLHDYTKHAYLLFCESYAPTTPPVTILGITQKSDKGASVFAKTCRTEATTLSPFGVTFTSLIGSVATHELGHVVNAEHHQQRRPAININYTPLASDQSAMITRSAADWTKMYFQMGPDGSTPGTPISLLSPDSDTFAELAAKISLLPGYSATVQPGAGGKYSYLASFNADALTWFWMARAGVSAIIKRSADVSVMEQGYHVQTYITPLFANSGPAADHEAKKLNFKVWF